MARGSHKLQVRVASSSSCLHSLRITKHADPRKVMYHVTKLLVQSVSSPTACLLVRNFGSDPIAEMLPRLLP